jgi:hypothetical protein
MMIPPMTKNEIVKFLDFDTTEFMHSSIVTYISSNTLHFIQLHLGILVVDILVTSTSYLISKLYSNLTSNRIRLS